PAFTMHTSLPSFADLPKSVGIVRTYDAIQRAFPGSQAPAEVVVEAPNVRSPRMQSALADLRRRALAPGVMSGPIHTDVNTRGTVARVEIPLAGDGEDAASTSALQQLRAKVLPAALGHEAGTTYAVTGETAGDHDFSQTVKSRAPLVFAFVLGVAFLLLL